MPNDERLDSIEHRLSELVERLERLEALHSSQEQAERSGTPVGTTPDAVIGTRPATSHEDRAGASDAPDIAADEATPTVPSAAFHEETKPSPPIAPPLDQSPARSASAPTRDVGFERLIGTRVTAIAGGLLVVAAAAFFVKLAYDRGWIGAVPPSLRAIALAAVGISFLVTADVLRHRFGSAAAAGLAIAGLGTLFVDGWAMGGILGLLPPGGALAALAITAVIGLVVTARFESKLIGVVSLVAGVLAPYIVGGGGDLAAGGLYFASLFVVAFGATVLRPRPFLGLRGVTFIILTVGSLPWLFTAIDDGRVVLILLITSIWWGVIHGSSIIAAVRGLDGRMGAGIGLASTVLIAIPTPLAVRAATGPTVSSLEGWVPLGLAFLCIAMSFQLGPGLNALRPMEGPLRRTERCIRLMAAVFWLEAGMLGMLAAALLLSGVGIPVAWLFTALIVSYFARVFASRAASIFAGVLGLAGQYAAMIAVMVSFGPATTVWFDQTPFALAAVPQFWIQLVGFALLLVVAINWWVPSASADHSSDGRGPIGPGLLLGASIPGVLVPLVFSAGIAWQLVGALVLLLGLVLVVSRRTDRAPGIFNRRLIAVVALLILGFTAAFSVIAIDASRPTLTGLVGVLDRWQSTVLLASVIGVGGLLIVSMIVVSERIPLPGNRPWSRPRGFFPGIGMAVTVATITVLVARIAGVDESAVMMMPLVGGMGVVLGTVILDRIRPGGRLLLDPEVLVGLACLGSMSWAIGGLQPFLESVPANSAAGSIDLEAWTGGLIVVLLLLAVRDLGRRRTNLAKGLWGVLTVVAFASGSFLVRGLAGPGTPEAGAGISIWWGSFAIGLLAIGFIRSIPLVRHVGLTLLGITAVKFLLIDLQGTETVYRVIIALVIGLLLVGTSVVYARFGRALDSMPSADGDLPSGDADSDPTDSRD